MMTEDTNQNPGSSRSAVMDINLLTDPVYPFRMCDGTRRWIAFTDLAGCSDGVTPDHPETGLRDLDSGLYEHFIALAQLVLAPRDEDSILDWIDDAAPTRETLVKRAEAWAPDFSVYAARAFQDPAESFKKTESVESLFLEARTEKAIWENLDSGLLAIDKCDIRIALIALCQTQRHSVGSGRDSRSGITGGGALRSYIEGENFLETILSNLLPMNEIRKRGKRCPDDRLALPWIEPTPSGGKTSKTPDNTPGLQLYFPLARCYALGQPRRPEPEERCAVTDEVPEWLVETIHKNGPRGEYDETLWRHPLTPYFAKKKGRQITRVPLTSRQLNGRIFWSDRRGLIETTATAEKGGRIAADIVTRWRENRAIDLGRRFVAVSVFGYETHLAQVLSWQEAHIREICLDRAKRETYEGELKKAVTISDHIARAMIQALFILLRSRDGKLESNMGSFEEMGRDDKGAVIRLIRIQNNRVLSGGFLTREINRFWSETEGAFNRLAQRLSAHLEEGGKIQDPKVMAWKQEFLQFICARAEEIYKARAQLGERDNMTALMESTRILHFFTRGDIPRKRMGLPTQKKKQEDSETGAVQAAA